MVTKRKLEDKYYGNKPLFKSTGSYYPDKYMLQYHEFEEPKEFNLWDTMEGIRLEEKPYKIVFGIKAKPEEFLKYDFLWCPDGPAFVAHRRAIEKLTEMCPDDFQAFPIEIKNLDSKDTPFINKDYYIINILNLVDAIDKEKSDIRYSKNGVPYIDKVILKENGIDGHLLARDRLYEPFILFDPKLAREFVKSKGINFLDEEEKNRYL